MTTSTSLARLHELLPQLFNPIEISGESYLRFQLTPELQALLPMEQVQEAILVPASSVTPLPNMPVFVLGMMVSRDRVFCVVDLGHLVGLPPMPINPQDYQVVVLRLPSTEPEKSDVLLAPEKWIGLAVRRVRGVVRCQSKQLQSLVDEFPECLTPYLRGCIVEGNKQSLVLDAVAIADSPMLLKNSFVQD